MQRWWRDFQRHATVCRAGQLQPNGGHAGLKTEPLWAVHQHFDSTLEKQTELLHNYCVNCKDCVMRISVFRRLRQDRAAAAAVEMALLLPALLGMTFAVIELGFAGVTYSAMMSSARTGAREMTFGMNGSAATAAVRTQLPVWVRAGASINTIENDSGMARVRISVPASQAALIPFIPFPGNLSVDITMPRVADK
jgi:hypothetical protein